MRTPDNEPKGSGDVNQEPIFPSNRVVNEHLSIDDARSDSEDQP